MMTILHPMIPSLAFLQSTQLNVFERFLNQAIAGIDSTSITSGMQKVSYVVLLVAFLWQVYQSALHGGDVRGLGTNLIKYMVTAIVVMNYHSIFTTTNQGFVNAGDWVNGASGASNLFDNWANDLKTQFNEVGFQKLWGLVTADLPGLIDAILIVVAYVLYPVVIVIFGFFYMLYGSILYIFGPIVIALMPLGATNRLAKSYAENVFIWNAWPVLYGGFGALLSAVQMGQIGQMLDHNSFLGGLGNLEGSILIGLASIIYSLAIAVIPFIAKRIVSGDVGSTATTLLGAAATALAAGIAGADGVSAGLSGASSGSGWPARGAQGNSPSSSGGASTVSGNDKPASPQRPTYGTQSPLAPTSISGSATAGEHAADVLRESFSQALNGDTSDVRTSDSSPGHNTGRMETSGLQDQVNPKSSSFPSLHSSRPPGATTGRGHAHGLTRPGGLATWGAYHAARLATRTVTGGARSAHESTKR